MTIIAARGSWMAADSQGSFGQQPYHCVKIYRTASGIVGMAGEASACLAFAQHFDGQEVPPEHLKGASALVLCKDGIMLYDESERGEVVKDPFFAIGAGAPVAMGAMQMGATAKQAVLAACRWNIDCGPPAVAMQLKPAAKGRVNKVKKHGEGKNAR